MRRFYRRARNPNRVLVWTLQHRCLQTSCEVEQLRLQDGLPVAPPGVTAVGMQLFMQFIAAVSQLTWQVSVVVCSDGGVMGTGVTV
jgi:hypothetical protein